MRSHFERISAVRESMGTDKEIYKLNLSSLFLNKFKEVNDLTNLEKFDLSLNLIRKIENLDQLSNLKYLILKQTKSIK